MKSHSRVYTIEVRPNSLFVHDGKKRGSQVLYSYMVDGIQTDYYVVTPDRGVSEVAFERAAVESWHHAKNLGIVVRCLHRPKRKRPKSKPLEPDEDGRSQGKLL